MDSLAKLQRLLDTSAPASLGPERRPGTLGEKEIRHGVSAALKNSKLAAPGHEAILGLMLLWHDHLETAHAIAQDLENPDGAFVHGIMHRREPDPSNAAYWFRRVGAHRAFETIAPRAVQLLSGSEFQELREQLVPGNQWDPFGFINACSRLRDSKAGAAQRRVLENIQQIEFQSLLAWLAREAV